MTLTAAVWLIILTALVLANLPFALNRPLAPWPWRMAGGPLGGWWRWGRTALFLLALAAWSWGTLQIVGGAFSGGGSSAGLFFVKLMASALLAALLLYWPGWEKQRLESAAGRVGVPGQPEAAGPAPSAARRADQATDAGLSADDAEAARLARALRRNPALAKPFIDRLLELLVGYVLAGTLGYALELNRGNAFHQQWEFYAVTLALFLVLGYPGFVLRYMIKHNYRGI